MAVSRSTLNLALLVLAAGLAAAAWFSREKPEPGPPLTPHAASAVTRIAIEHPGEPAIRLEKDGDAWRLVAPVAAQADPLEVNALLGLADREVQETLDAAGVNPAELGLEPPRYAVTLNDTLIAFGDVEPLQYRRYVKTGDTVRLIEDPPGAALDADYADLVAKNLFPAGSEIERVQLPKLALARDDAGAWALRPADPKATADQMQKLADGWKNARAMWNERDPDAARARGEAVSVTIRGGEPVKFLVTEREPQFKLLRPELGVRYVLSKALTEELLRLPDPPPPAEEAPEAPAGPADTEDAGAEP